MILKWGMIMADKKKELVIGIDIGGTYIKSGLVDKKGNVVAKERRLLIKITNMNFLSSSRSFRIIGRKTAKVPSW